MKPKSVFSIIIMMLFAVIGLYCALIYLYSSLDYRVDGITWYEHLMTLIVSCQTIVRVKDKALQREGDL